MQTATLIIPAMKTEAIAIQVAMALEGVAGVGKVQVTLSHALARVGFDETIASDKQLRSALNSAGFVVNEAPAHSCCGGCGG